MMVSLEPNAVSEAEVHDGMDNLARRLVGHHAFDPPESIAGPR